MKPTHPLGTRRRLLTAAVTAMTAALAVLVAVPPVDATHAGACFGTITPIGKAVYRDERFHPVSWPFSPQPRDVFYLESNGIPGLQSGGLDVTGTVGDPCYEGDHDTLLFCRRGCYLL